MNQRSDIGRPADEPSDGLGKIPRGIFEGIIRPRLGAKRAEVVVGPAHGIDAGIVDLGGGQVMAVTADPLFIAPELGWERAGWFAVQIVASDAVTSGLSPGYCTIDLNLPLELRDSDLAALWEPIHDACLQIGMAIVTGHTGRYEGCAFPTVGGMTVICTGKRDRYVTPAMAAAGDDVVITKGAAIETAGMLGAVCGDRIARTLGANVARDAANLFWQMSVVPDAMVASEVGVRDRGVTAMHDATERGVWNAVCELADASGLGLIVDEAAVPVLPAVRAVCDFFEIDPYSSSSEGTLLLTCKRHRTEAVLAALNNAGILARRIGEMTPPSRGVQVIRNGREEQLTPPVVDPFWGAYTQARECEAVAPIEVSR